MASIDLDDLNCSICYQPFRDPVQPVAACSHHFCLDCITPWIAAHGSCPYDRNPCTDVGPPSEALVQALERLDHLCECQWSGKWVHHQVCPLVTCSMCSWKSYDNGATNLVSRKDGEKRLHEHFASCTEREQVAKPESWVNGTCLLRWGMTVKQVEGVLDYGYSAKFSGLAHAPQVKNFECRYLCLTIEEVRVAMPHLPPPIEYDQDSSWVCLFFGQETGLCHISVHFGTIDKRNNYDVSGPPLVGYFTAVFGVSLIDQTAHVLVRASPECLIYIADSKHSFLNGDPGAKTLLEFIDPNVAPANGLDYTLAN